MRYCTLRHIVSILLLAIYLPTVAVSSLHVHNETIDSQDDCRQCTGHIELAHHHEHNCPYCHFLSLNYIGQPAEQSRVLLPTCDRHSTETVAKAVTPRYGVCLLRAPPTA